MKLGRDLDVRIRIDSYEVSNEVTSITAILAAKQHVSYNVVVFCNGQEWRFMTRYSAIAAVYKVLRDRFPNVPPLPPKTVVRQFSHAQVEDRRHRLNHFFDAVCKRKELLNCPEFASFLHLPENAVEFRSGVCTAPSQVAELVEMGYGIEDVHYDMEHGYLLIGSCDNSLGSKLDSALSSLKLRGDKGHSRMSMWKQSCVSLKFDLMWSCDYATGLSKVAYSSTTGHAFCALANGSIGFKPKNREITKNTLPMVKHTDVVVALVFDELELWLFSSSKDGRVHTYDVRNERAASDITCSCAVNTLAVDSCERRLYGGTQGGQIYCWDISYLPPQIVSHIAAPEVWSMHFSTEAFDVPTLFVGSKEGIAVTHVHSADGQSWGIRYGTIPARHSPISLTFAASSREVLVGNSDGTVAVFDLDTGRPTFVFQAHQHAVTCLIFLDAPRRLITASKDKRLRFWDFPSMRIGSLLRESEPAFNGASCKPSLEDLAFSPRLNLPPGSELPKNGSQTRHTLREAPRNHSASRGRIRHTAIPSPKGETYVPPTLSERAQPPPRTHGEGSGIEEERPHRFAFGKSAACCQESDSDDNDFLVGWNR